ncbi:MAG: hypothetical protein WA725_14030, partial [Pseudolabrys sp.]
IRLLLSFIIGAAGWPIRGWAQRAEAQPVSPAGPDEMKIDELLRNAPANIHDLHLALAGLPNNMKVKAHPETGVSEKTVDELRARTTWLAGLGVMTPRKLKPKSVVKITKRLP